MSYFVIDKCGPINIFAFFLFCDKFRMASFIIVEIDFKNIMIAFNIFESLNLWIIR